MTYRVSRKGLEARVQTLNKHLNETFCLDYNSVYGYCLENDEGNYRISNRMSAREMSAYLSGMLALCDFVHRTKKEE